MFNSMNNTTGIDSIAYSKSCADTVSAVHSLDSYSDIVRNTLGKSNNTPDILRSTVKAEFNARSLEERLKALKDVKKDKLCVISFGRGFYKLQESGKYHLRAHMLCSRLMGKCITSITMKIIIRLTLMFSWVTHHLAIQPL